MLLEHHIHWASTRDDFIFDKLPGTKTHQTKLNSTIQWDFNGSKHQCPKKEKNPKDCPAEISSQVHVRNAYKRMCCHKGSIAERQRHEQKKWHKKWQQRQGSKLLTSNVKKSVKHSHFICRLIFQLTSAEAQDFGLSAHAITLTHTHTHSSILCLNLYTGWKLVHIPLGGSVCVCFVSYRHLAFFRLVLSDQLIE